MRHVLLLWLAAFVFITCKTSTTPQEQDFSFNKKKGIVLLDSSQAAQAILIDESEMFFEQITSVDMMVQMKKTFPVGTDRSIILKEYQQFLREDVATFSKEEEIFIEKVFQAVYETAQAVNPKIFPEQIELIKSHAKHYGPSVYYTRENRIVIPTDALEKQSFDDFLGVMFHELFHVYSRLNPKKKAALYSLIGFKDIGMPKDLIIPEALAQRILLNPDGVDFAEAIELNTQKGKVKAIPVISSNSPYYIPKRPNFFNYLQFGLFEVKANSDGQFEVACTVDGASTLDSDAFADFRRQIKDNTDYIIHPDEVLADNFMYLMMMERQNDSFQMDNYSTAGQALLKQILEIISK